MKVILFVVLLILPLGLIIGQNTYLNIPIFQGCEKFENNKSESSKCFSEKFKQAISDNINSDFLNQIYWNKGKKVANSKIKFRVNKNGIIEDVQSIGESDIDLFQQVVIAIQKINQNYSIKPARIGNESSNFNLQIPIIYNVPKKKKKK